MRKKKREPNNVDTCEEPKEKKEFVVVKCGLKKIMRNQRAYDALNEKSIISTKISVLGSLDFLCKIQYAFDNHDVDLFRGDGSKVIRESFMSVLQQSNSNYLVDIMHNLNDRFEWPRNRFFANGVYYLHDTYETNLKNNLMMHIEERIRYYLRVKVHQQNDGIELLTLTANDIENAIKWMVNRQDIIVNSIDDFWKRVRREKLIQMIRDISWFSIENDNVSQFTADLFLCSLPMWLSMQRAIEEYQMNNEEEHEPRQPRQPRQRPRNHRQKRRQDLRRYNDRKKLKQKKYKEQRKLKKKQQQQEPNSNENVKKPPKIKNLVVIPICKFKRAHYTMDNSGLYDLCCQLEINARDQYGGRIRSTQFDNEQAWRELFDIHKINRMGGRKQFHRMILTDGVSVSILYEKPASDTSSISKEEIKEMLARGDFGNLLGIDPGMKTKNATVRHNIATGKEVSVLLLFFFFE